VFGAGRDHTRWIKYPGGKWRAMVCNELMNNKLKI
jgi:hypothetical protein